MKRTLLIGRLRVSAQRAICARLPLGMRNSTTSLFEFGKGVIQDAIDGLQTEEERRGAILAMKLFLFEAGEVK